MAGAENGGQVEAFGEKKTPPLKAPLRPDGTLIIAKSAFPHV